jgi:hypothetical protein
LSLLLLLIRSTPYALLLLPLLLQLLLQLLLLVLHDSLTVAALHDKNKQLQTEAI